MKGIRVELTGGMKKGYQEGLYAVGLGKRTARESYQEEELEPEEEPEPVEEPELEEETQTE